jgi:uncharacterized protein
MRCQSESTQSHTISVPVFPLPNVVFFPRALLPLHIFEERYKAMTADVLAGDRLVAMALLRPGWEANYYCTPAIEPVVCVGKIVSSERLEDGKFNFLLHGRMRARIIEEERSRPYRIVRVQPMPESPILEIDLANQRQQLIEMICSEPLVALPATQELKRIVTSPMGTGDVADLLAYHLLNNVALKQALLADTDIPRRVSRLISALDAALPMLQLAATGAADSGPYN